MIENNDWLIMTYYCPTHGSENRLEPINLSLEEIKRLKVKTNQNQQKK